MESELIVARGAGRNVDDLALLDIGVSCLDDTAGSRNPVINQVDRCANELISGAGKTARANAIAGITVRGTR